jgi:LmbE family N-acetylglucosaminyl deacetylase
VILGGISRKEITPETVYEIVEEKLVKMFDLFAVFSHSPKDDHHDHIAVSIGSDSACKKVGNLLHYAGPLRKPEFSPNCFFTFSEAEWQQKLKALKLFEEAHEKTRYFSEEYLTENLWLGQKVFEYVQRENTPYLIINGKKILPYAEGFEVRRLRDPF